MSSTTNKNTDETTADKIIRLYKEGKTKQAIADEIGCVPATVTNNLKRYTDIETRPYNNEFRLRKKGTVAQPKAMSKTTILEAEVRDLKSQLSKMKSLYKSSQNTNAKMKTELITHDAEKTKAQNELKAKEKEYEKLAKEHAKVKATLQTVQIEGYETPALIYKHRAELVKELEDKNVYLTRYSKADGWTRETEYVQHLIPKSQSNSQSTKK